jgi:hypothetical protein
MAPAGTWLKVILVLVGLGMLGMCAIAGAGVYFVSQHVSTATVPAADALRQFEEARTKFKGQLPLIEFDAEERATQLRPIADLPTAATPATSLVVMAWDPDDERIVNFRIPLWVLGLGEQKVDLGVGAESFDLNRMKIDVKDLQRVGPALVIDMKASSGSRALVWTQ